MTTAERRLPTATLPQRAPTRPRVETRPTVGRTVWGRRFARRLAVTDLVMIAAAGIGVHLAGFSGRSVERYGVGVGPVAMTVLFAAAWFAALSFTGTRRPLAIGFGPAEYKMVIRVSLAVFGAVALMSYLAAFPVPRGYMLLMLPIGLFSLLAGRYVWRRWLQARRDFGHYQSAVLAVGSRSTVTALVRDLQKMPRAGYRVVAVCLTDRHLMDVDETLDGLPVVGGVDDVKAAVRRSGADAVAVTASAEIDPSVVRKLSWDLEDTNAGLILAPALTDIAGPRVHTQPINGLPLIHVDRPTYRGANKVVKKSFDFLGTALILVLFSVPMLLIALAVKLTSDGPVFFRQSRVGLNGSMFKMVKFRTMVVDAESQLEELKRQRLAAETGEAGNDVLFKMKDDPRITRIGKILRRLSLDELPQLFNVLTGSMSLVGPRPPLADEVAQYESDARRRLLVRPGMTGLWQVSGRSDLSWDESVRLDSYYVENWSITGDLVILWKTARVMLSSDGAY
ncbi:sugar transferase [Nakamurella sp. A5-74]|uniref:Sugar transferase n=1 Tax=Nakamurella sp. A5-74 TaxID=3158264 RepID=A0AAU8DNJ2_9ACTN